jgi:hypothetical protein
MARRAGARIGGLLVTSLLCVGALSSCTTTARITDLYSALDADGFRQRNVFFTDTKEIHCVVEMGVGREGVTVEAVVRQLQAYNFVNNQFFETDRVAANVETSPQRSEGVQKVDLILSPSGPNGEDAAGAPFPPGRFQCEAYLDGKLERIAIFNIDFPDCPTAQIRAETLCFGFYKDGDTCPKYGVTSRDPAKCRCTALKGWECDP